MEELKSTEALDREILEDARRKAERTLRAADQAAEAAELAWAKKADAAVAELERKHVERVAARRKETLARLPLDKRRERAIRAERLLRRAMGEYLRALPRERLLQVVARELSERVGALPPSGLSASAQGFEPGEAEALLRSAFPDGSWTLAAADPSSYVDPSAFAEDRGFPSLVVEGGDVIVRAAVDAAAEELLRERRTELAVALLGEEAGND